MMMVEILKEKLKQIFTKTQHRVFDDFLNEVETTASIVDIASQFPIYLRMQKKDQGLVQAAYFEWLIYSRAQLDWGRARVEKGFVVLDPSLEILPLTKGADYLQIPQGVYAIFKDEDRAQVRKLSEKQLQLLEILREGDRKFRPQQLLEVVSSEITSEWELALSELIEAGAISLGS